MQQITPYLLKLYLSSLTIREKVILSSRIKQTYPNPELEKSVNKWKIQVGEASDLFFKKRLEWSQINENDLSKLLNTIKEFDSGGFDFPRWIIDINEFQCQVEVNESYNDQSAEIPFSSLLYPLVDYFYNQLKSIPFEFSKNSVNDLKRSLLKHLSRISSQSLLEHMYATNLSYKDFIELTQNDNYKNFFSEYPYLAKLIFVRGRFWLENTSKLFKAFENDKYQLKEKLNDVSLKITNIKGDLSESHNYGKNVVILETSSSSFVLKHRNVEAECKFFNFLEYLNKEFYIQQYIPWIINGDGYGWMEYVAQEHCHTKSEVKNYYKRIGSQLCLHYIFGSTDLHSENLIAYGEYPVFIDLETLLNPLIKLNNEHINSLNEYIDFKFGLSVSRAGILPQWLMGPDTNVYNNSSLGGSKVGLFYPSIRWDNINTDQITYDYVELPPPEDKNLVYFDFQHQDPALYTKEIQEGFTKTYKFFFENRESPLLLNEFQKFSNIPVRFVFRATKVYTLLLEYLNHPDYMRSGIERALEMEILAKGLLVDFSKKYIFWNVLDDELSQLENNDIPYYSTNTSKISLISINKELYKKAFQYKSYEMLLKVLKNLSMEDLEFQLQIIKSSVETSTKQTLPKEFLTYKNSNYSVPTKKELEAVIFDIGERLINSRISIDGRSTWVSYVSNIISHTYGYKPVGLDIANGNMGVAIFIAALFNYTGKKFYKNSLDPIIQPILDVLNLEWSKKEFMFRFGTGGTTGIASIIYGFTKLYEFMGESKYLEYADRFINIITKDDINQSIRQDVVSGNAGLLLALIKLTEVTTHKKREITELMSYCFEVIETNGYANNLFKSWDYQQSKQLLGFSHGSSGILYTLSRYLHYKQSDENVNKVISDILFYEEGYFNAHEINWPDFRFETPDINVVSWCHGATGIGMSRLQLYKNELFLNESKRDIKRALSKTIQTGAHILDTVCCGNSGRIDFLLELEDTDLYDEDCRKYMNWLINRLISEYKVNKDFKYFSKFDTEDVNVGFYQGISGIGYELLRVLNPQKFNSMLLFK